jgi:hypothetical protein
MPKKWPKGSIPDDNVERLKLAVTRASIVPLSAEERRQAKEIVEEWTRLNLMALALGVHLTKHDYREFMLRKIGIKN